MQIDSSALAVARSGGYSILDPKRRSPHKLRMIVIAIIVNTTMANEIGIVANAYRENTQMFHTISSTAATTSSPMRVAGVRLTPPFWCTSLNRCTDPSPSRARSADLHARLRHVESHDGCDHSRGGHQTRDHGAVTSKQVDDRHARQQKRCTHY